MSELKDCPMCGNQPRLVDLEGWEIWCKCGVQLCLEQPDKEPLVEAWNHRVPVSTPQQSAQRASVDTPEFRKLLWACQALRDGQFCDRNNAEIALIAHINALGSAGSGAPADPMDWPIPCDLKTGACTIRKGCSLRTVVARMESLHRMATAALPKLSPEERQANWEALQALAAPAPQGEQA